MRICHHTALLVLCLLTDGFGVCQAQRVERVQSPDSSCRSSHVRNTGRALLCGQVVDSASGRGVGGGLFGGNARFVRVDGREMNGPIGPDGRFSLNVAGGHGTLTLNWSCRPERVFTDTLTLAPGTGTAREFAVAADAADTLCRVSIAENRADLSPSVLDRWLHSGSCWSVRYEPWLPELGIEYPVSTWIQLAAPDSGARGQTFRDSLDVRAPWRMRRWQPIRGDSIEISWSTGFSAVTLTLGAFGDSLSGSGLWTFDVIRTDSLGFVDNSGLPRANVSARRTACP
jgi:hypothetical protein